MYYGYSIHPDELQNIQRIGVLCWGLIGDVFMRIPVIEALHQRFPNAVMTVIVDPAGKQVVQNHPMINRVVVLPRKKRPLGKYILTMLSTILQLRRDKYDLFVNLYSGGSSPFVTRMTNARIRLGFDHTPALRRSNNLLVVKPSFCQHWTKGLGKKLQPLGVSDAQIRRGSSFYVTAAAKQSIARYIPTNTQVIAMNLGAGIEAKRWPVDNFVALAKQIHSTNGIVSLVFTNPGMEHLADEFSRLYGSGSHILPSLSLDEIGAVMLRCCAVITGDTSLMHLAVALKVPNLVLFTDTRPEIVEPEDCIQVPCFIEDPQRINECGKPSGTVHIPVEYAYSQFQQLLQKIEGL